VDQDQLRQVLEPGEPFEVRHARVAQVEVAEGREGREPLQSGVGHPRTEEAQGPQVPQGRQVFQAGVGDRLALQFHADHGARGRLLVAHDLAAELHDGPRRLLLSLVGPQLQAAQQQE
jgi:hypothetical protein